MLVDHHLHLENGDFTLDYIAQFCEVARARGVETIGFSEHAYNFRESQHLWPAGWNMDPQFSLEAYVDCLLRAREAGYPVRLGIEMDYLPEKEAEIARFLSGWPWDYIIGSIHHLGDWGFDHPDQRHLWQRQDIYGVYRHYFQQLSQAAVSGLFDIMAHPDLVKIFRYRPEASPDSLYRQAADSMARGGVTAEVNTAGLRKPAGEIYPAPGFLEILYQQGVPIVISSDAHYPGDTAADFPAALTLARRCGYEKTAVFRKRRQHLAELPAKL